MGIPIHSLVREKNPEGFPREYWVVGRSVTHGLVIMETDPPHRIGYAKEEDLEIILED